MNLDDQLHILNITEESAKAKVDMVKSLNKLVTNKDFKKVILEGYFEKEAARLVMLKAEPNHQDEASQVQIINSINGIGSLRQYFLTLEQLGMMAEKSLKECSEYREQLLTEEEGD